MTSKSIAAMRISYTLDSLGDREVLSDPIKQFSLWFDEAIEASRFEANAMIVSTIGADGFPQSRTVLLKGFDENGLVFYTNYDSAKGQSIAGNAHISALFYWPALQRQVRWTGYAEKVSSAESDAYFVTRPRGSQLGAWSSNQSRPIASSEALHDRFQALEQQYGDSIPIPRPDHWGGYRIRPVRIEFWQGRENRLHDRILYTLQSDGTWDISRLAP